ncbi:MAG: TatD family hydrolase [Candidatus Methanomethylophilaceae archaeon]|nr:TatD family hydrolase [Candidatus Methanomethylophilaceae archaeon]
MDLPVYDDHFHVSPSGRNVDAMREYKAAGGTGMTLVTLPYSEVQITCGEDFRRSFQITIDYAKKGRELGLDINCAIGPYPILLIPLATHYGIERAEQILMEGMRIAHEMISSGEAQLMGEVGRPHFDTEQRYVDACNRVLQYGMDLAHENDYAVMIHCESEDHTFSSLASMARSAGLPERKVIKHSSPPLVTQEETFGVTPSIPCSRTLIREALSKGRDFMVETEYIDDPEKPTAMMSLNTVPKRIKGFHQSGELTDDDVIHICREMPDSLYSK